MDNVTVPTAQIDTALLATREMLKLVPQVFEANRVPARTTMMVFRALTEVASCLHYMLPAVPGPTAIVELEAIDATIATFEELATAVKRACELHMPSQIETLCPVFLAFGEGLQALRAAYWVTEVFGSRAGERAGLQFGECLPIHTSAT